mgnify:CR=1 FL=1
MFIQGVYTDGEYDVLMNINTEHIVRFRKHMMEHNYKITMIDGEELKTHLAGLRKLLKVKPVNTVIIRRKLADESVSRSGYIF